MMRVGIAEQVFKLRGQRSKVKSQGQGLRQKQTFRPCGVNANFFLR